MTMVIFLTMLPPEPRIWYGMYLIVYGYTVRIIMTRPRERSLFNDKRHERYWQLRHLLIWLFFNNTNERGIDVPDMRTSSMDIYTVSRHVPQS